MPILQTLSTVRRKSAEILNDSLRRYLYGLLDQLKSEGYAEETLHNLREAVQRYFYLISYFPITKKVLKEGTPKTHTEYKCH